VAVNIGTQPTFGENRRQVEAHLLDFAGDLYGRAIAIELHDWLREQTRFASVDQLKHQIGRDLARVRQYRGFQPWRGVAHLSVA
jgi:riboflavin kinase/FMN adenylyltransferase